MKYSLLITGILFALLSCDKSSVEDPAVGNNVLLKTECLTETSEVAYENQSVLDTDGFVEVNRFYSADGKFKETRYAVLMYDPKAYTGLDLKSAYFNNKPFQVAANGQFQLTDSEENKTANWRFTLPDGTAIEICTSQFPKVLNLSAIPKPVSGKEWKFDLDISANKADYVQVSNNKFFSYGSLEGEGNVSTDKMSLTFSSAAVKDAMDDAKFFKQTSLQLYAKTGKSLIKTVKGKKIKVIVNTVSVVELGLF
ncbi:MAG: hypothetical protein U5N85_11775 [Arcicella sp.]|nr:hypothetical protein [Arcicella sp.]